MCLVLGCPGAGCSTFLKTIANQWGEFADVGGDVRYAGIDAMEMAKYYMGEVAYNQEGQLLIHVGVFLESDDVTRRYPHIDVDSCSDAGIRTLDQNSGAKWSSSRRV